MAKRNAEGELEEPEHWEPAATPVDLGLGTPGVPPTLTSLSPDAAASGDADFVLHCRGSDFTPSSVIYFGPTEDEPTTFVSSTEVTTGVKPALFEPAVVPVTVRTSGVSSNALDFTFTAQTKKSEPHRQTGHKR
jgi:hypothetical protein